MNALQWTVGAVHVTGPAQVLLIHMFEQHGVLPAEPHAAPSFAHIGCCCAVQTPETHALPLQQSPALMQGAPTTPQTPPESKSLVTLAAALGRKTIVTFAVTPAVSVTGVGSLIQVGIVDDVTAEQTPGNACSVKFTFPTGRPPMASLLDWPAVRLNDWVTVRLPVTVISRHVPFGGTVVTSIETLAVSSPPGPVEAAEQPMPARTAHTADA
jgi:hypothetical protein